MFKGTKAPMPIRALTSFALRFSSGLRESHFSGLCQEYDNVRRRQVVTSSVDRVARAWRWRPSVFHIDGPIRPIGCTKQFATRGKQYYALLPLFYGNYKPCVRE